jgi:hypothetical protein
MQQFQFEIAGRMEDPRQDGKLDSFLVYDFPRTNIPNQDMEVIYSSDVRARNASLSTMPANCTAPSNTHCR